MKRIPQSNRIAKRSRTSIDFRTGAYLTALQVMGVPTGLMSFASGGRGKPTKAETTLFLGAASFTYAVWENYVEEVAIELSERLARGIDPECIPEASKAEIERDATPWDLSVHPGWRGLWVDRVTHMTKGGDGGQGGWGLNSATFKNAERVFEVARFGGALPERLTVKTRASVPRNVGVTKGEVDVRNTLTQLIAVRGEAVHTAKAPEHLRKGHVNWWLNSSTRC